MTIPALPVPTVQYALPHTTDLFTRFECYLPIANSSMQRVYGQLRELVQPPSRVPTPFEMPYNPPNIPQNEPEPEQDDNMRAHVGRSTDMA
jgi:hypothetical protein